MQDPKTQKPVRQPELPNNRNEEVQKQPAKSYLSRANAFSLETTSGLCKTSS